MLHYYSVFAVTCIQFNPVNDEYFISGSIDGKVRIWAINSCQVLDWMDIRDIVTAVSYRPDGKVYFHLFNNGTSLQIQKLELPIEQIICFIQGGIIGCMAGSCRFFSLEGNILFNLCFVVLLVAVSGFSQS